MDLSVPVIAVFEFGRDLSDAFCGLCNVKLSAMIVCSQRARVSDMSRYQASLRSSNTVLCSLSVGTFVAYLSAMTDLIFQ